MTKVKGQKRKELRGLISLKLQAKTDRRPLCVPGMCFETHPKSQVPSVCVSCASSRLATPTHLKTTSIHTALLPKLPLLLVTPDLLVIAKIGAQHQLGHHLGYQHPRWDSIWVQVRVSAAPLPLELMCECSWEISKGRRKYLGSSTHVGERDGVLVSWPGCWGHLECELLDGRSLFLSLLSLPPSVTAFLVDE